MQLKGPDDGTMSLQLAAAQERHPASGKVVKLIAPEKRGTSPSELVKLISSKVNPGKVRNNTSNTDVAPWCCKRYGLGWD